MNIDSLSSAAGKTIAGMSMLKQGMDMQKSEMAQLLQAMPQAPQPANLGQNVNVLA